MIVCKHCKKEIFEVKDRYGKTFFKHSMTGLIHGISNDNGKTFHRAEVDE